MFDALDPTATPDDARELRRRHKAASRARLVAHVTSLHRHINKPLPDVVRDHVLPLLPVQSLLRFRAVSTAWSNAIKAPLFAHRQSSSHRTISGLFYHQFSTPCFAPFSPKSANNLPDGYFDFLPACHDVTVLSSCNGLLLVRTAPLLPPKKIKQPTSQADLDVPDPFRPFFQYGQGDDYDTEEEDEIDCAGTLERDSLIVCNPVTGARAYLPDPPAAAAVSGGVLVYKTGVYNFRPDYFVVVPFRIEGGLFGFQCFSSAAGEWWVSDSVCAAESIVFGSGVAAGGVAYWRTSMQTVVSFEPATDKVTQISWPCNYSTDVDWSIGCAGDKLFVSSATDWAVSVFRLVDGLDGWLQVWEASVSANAMGYESWRFREDGSFVVNKKPVCLGFQSGEMEFLFLDNGNVIGVDIVRKAVRLVVAGEELKEDWGPFVSHINTFAGVVPLDYVEEENFKVKEEDNEEEKKTDNFAVKEEVDKDEKLLDNVRINDEDEEEEKKPPVFGVADSGHGAAKNHED